VKKLQGKVALVTGGARGLGRAYVLRLAGLGADVVVNDINLEAAKEFSEDLTAKTVMEEVQALGCRSIGIQADVTDPKQVENMVEKTLSEFGRLDILVNNAGGYLAPFERGKPTQVPPEDVEKLLNINLVATMYCCQAASKPMMAQRSGRIVNVGSQAGLKAQEDGGMVAYGVAKAGIINYTKYLACELGPYGVNVNSISPAWILSSRAVAQGRNSPEVRGKLEPQIALRRLGLPEDCAKVVEFLATDLSDYVTGQNINVCGGFVLF
jgi:NAD(P)-dependent dehydrogenase (short-subunit alcohol dehydrogenase family)